MAHSLNKDELKNKERHLMPFAHTMYELTECFASKIRSPSLRSFLYYLPFYSRVLPFPCESFFLKFKYNSLGPSSCQNECKTRIPSQTMFFRSIFFFIPFFSLSSSNFPASEALRGKENINNKKKSNARHVWMFWGRRVF